jgi:hypothetical protein
MDCSSAQNVLAKSRRLVLVSRNLLRLLAERIKGTERNAMKLRRNFRVRLRLSTLAGSERSA